MLILCGSLQATQKVTTYEQTRWCMKNTTIGCDIEGNEVGYIECVRLPCSFYVVHNFYVYPEHRGKGIGKALLAHMCTLLKTKGAYKAYLQPGPFDLKDGEFVAITDVQEHQDKMKKLVTLYRSVGFCSVHPCMFALVGCLYKIVRASEDARNLMVMQ